MHLFLFLQRFYESYSEVESNKNVNGKQFINNKILLNYE